MEHISLEKVFFKIKIENVIPVATKIIVAGKVICGQIHDKSNVIITNTTGLILKRTRVKDLDWFDRGRSGEHVIAYEGMNIAIVFDVADKEHLQVNNFIIIE